MTEQAIVVRQHEPAPAPAPPTGITGLGGPLPEVMQMCNAIAAGGQLVPKDYRGNAGAVLLAKLWADSNGVDVFTAMQNMSVIEGRPFVSAAMRVKLATAQGFEFRVVETTREVCTIHVHRGDTPVGEPVTCRFDDRPRRMTYQKSGAPTPWSLYPDDMLFAEASRKADRRYVQTAAALIDAGQDFDDDEVAADPVAVITEAQADEALFADRPAPGPEPAPPADPPAAAEDPGAITLDELRESFKSAGKGVTELKAVKAARARFPDLELANLAAAHADPQALDYVIAWRDAGGQEPGQ